ncbi:hypothetical protein [Streptomyces sp. NPDC051219]|uniref:hypothetical protein n=1 Tax=Streptomyces sp. NPDC051219 TaxID=3155283 RepID=UPI00344963EA
MTITRSRRFVLLMAATALAAGGASLSTTASAAPASRDPKIPDRCQWILTDERNNPCYKKPGPGDGGVTGGDVAPHTGNGGDDGKLPTGPEPDEPEQGSEPAPRPEPDPEQGSEPAPRPEPDPEQGSEPADEGPGLSDDLDYGGLNGDSGGGSGPVVN